jgi:vacuolar-type H+-ATPase subunit H/ribosomal protein L34
VPSDRRRYRSGGFDVRVNPAQGRAVERARDLDELDRESHSAGEHQLASDVSERIRTIIASAEAAANAVRHEAEERAQVKRRAAEEEARRILQDARRDADALLAERRRRISELSDAIVERTEQVVVELDRAADVRRQLQDLAEALGATAERMARELAEGGPLPPADAAGEASKPAAAEPEPEGDDPQEADAPSPPAEEQASVVELAEERPARRADDEARARREPDERLNARLVALQMAVAGGSRSEVEVHLRRNFDVNDLNGILDDVFGNGDDAQKPVAGPPRSGGAA